VSINIFSSIYFQIQLKEFELGMEESLAVIFIWSLLYLIIWSHLVYTGIEALFLYVVDNINRLFTDI